MHRVLALCMSPHIDYLLEPVYVDRVARSCVTRQDNNPGCMVWLHFSCSIPQANTGNGGRATSCGRKCWPA